MFFNYIKHVLYGISITLHIFFFIFLSEIHSCDFKSWKIQTRRFSNAFSCRTVIPCEGTARYPGQEADSFIRPGRSRRTHCEKLPSREASESGGGVLMRNEGIINPLASGPSPFAFACECARTLPPHFI